MNNDEAEFYPPLAIFEIKPSVLARDGIHFRLHCPHAGLMHHAGQSYGHLTPQDWLSIAYRLFFAMQVQQHWCDALQDLENRLFPGGRDKYGRGEK